MRLGFHLSVAGGIDRAAAQAAGLGLGCLQIFASNPRGWRQPPLRPGQVAAFRRRAAQAGLDPVVVHAPYLLNLASEDQSLWRRSCRALAAQLRRASALNCRAVVVHPGSRGGQPLAWGLGRVALAVKGALQRTGHQVAVWLENTAGGGRQLGGTLAQMARLLNLLEGQAVGAVLDTAHAWGAGYRLNNKAAVGRYLKRVERVLGLERVKLWHFNDSQAPLGSRRDRHQHLGQGLIGRRGFAALAAHPALRHAAVIMETPKDSPRADPRNLAYLQGLLRQGLR